MQFNHLYSRAARLFRTSQALAPNPLVAWPGEDAPAFYYRRGRVMKGNIDGQITTTGDHPESAYELYIYLSKEARSPAIEIRKTHPHTQADEGEGIIVVGRRMTHIKGLPDNVGELDALLPGLATPVKILGNGSTEHEKAIDAILTAMKDIHLGIERIPSVASPRSQIRSNAAER